MSILRNLIVLIPIGRIPSLFVNVVEYMHIIGLKVGALRADFLTNWRFGKHVLLRALLTLPSLAI